MPKNGQTTPYANKPSSDKAPDDIKSLGVSPIRTIKGPSLHNTTIGGNLVNNDGMDEGTSVISK